MKKIVILFIALVMAPACVTLNHDQSARLGEQLKAETRLMKNNLTLAQRENEILKAENRQYRKETVRLTGEIGRLNSDIDALNRKYDRDMAQMTEQYNRICEEYAFLEKSSGEKIQELTDLNLALDKRMKDEISRLNGAMAEQKASSEKARIALEQDFAGKKKKYLAQLSSLKETLNEKQAAMDSMKAMYDTALRQIENLQKQIDTDKAKSDDPGRKNMSLPKPAAAASAPGDARPPAVPEKAKQSN